MAKNNPTPTPIYSTLEELQREKPKEDDVIFEGKAYRVRGLTNAHINSIIKMTQPYQDIPALHLAKDESITIVYGLLIPSFGAVTEEEVLAASLMVEQWPKPISTALVQKIRLLTWPQFADEEEAEPLELE